MVAVIFTDIVEIRRGTEEFEIDAYCCGPFEPQGDYSDAYRAYYIRVPKAFGAPVDNVNWTEIPIEHPLPASCTNWLGSNP